MDVRDKPTVNGLVNPIDVAAQIINARTYIPLRFVTEALGDEVIWHPSPRAIDIVSAKTAYEPYPYDHAVNVIGIPADFSSIQSAINEASDGDVLLIAPGTYYETIDYLGKDIIITSEQGPDVTIIDGNRAGSVVSFHDGESNNAVLHGVTVTNGLIKSDAYVFGGGISIIDSSPTISHVTVQNNAAGADGGGIFIYGHQAQPVIENSIIRENLAQYHGGGIAINNGASPIIKKSLISANTAEAAGGIMVGGESTPVISDNTIEGNVSGFNFNVYHLHQFLDRIDTTDRHAHPAFPSGILIVQTSHATVTNNVITGNAGGGIGIMSRSKPIIENNYIARNSSHGDGAITGGVLVALHAEPVLMANTIIDNTGPDIWIDDTSLVNDEREESSIDNVNTIDSIVLWPLDMPPVETVSEQTIRVPQDYSSIQQAIDAAIHGDTIIVDRGTYTEDIDFLGKSITVMSTDPDDDAIVSATIIQGTGYGAAVKFIRGESREARLTGFTIVNRQDSAIDISSASPTIRNNVITAGIGVLMNHPYTPLYIPDKPLVDGPYTPVIGAKTAPLIENNDIRDSSGGGIHFYYASPEITGNTITNNIGESGGIWGWFSHPVIKDNVLTDNEAGLGGAIYFENFSSPTITGNLIKNNRSLMGGGIYVDSPTYATIDHNVFINNEAQPGGAMAINYNARVTATNNVFARNYGGAISVGNVHLDMAHNTLVDNIKEQGQPWTQGMVTHFSVVTVVNSIFYNSEIVYGDLCDIDVSYSLIYDGRDVIWPGEGNLHDKPLFVPGDYRLTRGSAGIDAGIDAGVYVDIDGTVRPQGQRPDMGAYENKD